MMPLMDLERKESLARIANMGIEACAERLKAARGVTRKSQRELALAMGVSATTLNNAERALTYPSRDMKVYLFRAHRIDFNFILHGDFAQLPGGVQESLFAELEALKNVPGRKER